MSERIVRLKIVLDDTEPPIWRAVELSAATDLKGLHRVIQAAMGWEEAHLHAFEHGRRKLGDRVRLDELVDGGIKRFGYLYDMGDSWQHTLHVEKTLAADPQQSYPRLVDGAGRCPPEDCGGIPGFYVLLEALADPAHPDHDDRMDWHGGPFDAADMDTPAIRERLAQLAARQKHPANKRHSEPELRRPAAMTGDVAAKQRLRY